MRGFNCLGRAGGKQLDVGRLKSNPLGVIAYKNLHVAKTIESPTLGCTFLRLLRLLWYRVAECDRDFTPFESTDLSQVFLKSLP